MITPHPEYETLLARMKNAMRHAHPWQGTVFRAAEPKWANHRHMITGMGSMKSGGRFNAFGSFPAIYASTGPELAMTESLAYYRRTTIPVSQAMPLVFRAMSLKVSHLLDLTDAGVLEILLLSREQMQNEEWWKARAMKQESRSQAIGRAAHACKVEAILASSAHATDPSVNIIVFPANLMASSDVKVLRRNNM